MLEIATITFKSFGKVKCKDIVIPNQVLFFNDYEALKKACTLDSPCDDFVVYKVKFRKVEVFT